MDSDDFLPDIDDMNNGKTIEQVIFENKVYDKNCKFVIQHNGIKQFYQSDSDNRFYPDFAKKNKCAFRKKAKNYYYDSSRDTLQKLVQGVDGIGKCIFHNSVKPSDFIVVTLKIVKLF